MMPRLLVNLARLVALPSVSAPGFPEPRQPLRDAYANILEFLRDAGVENIGALELPETARS